jgi:hypothetical protein
MQWTVVVYVRPFGAVGRFYSRIFVVFACDKTEARLVACRMALDEGYETRMTNAPVLL